MITFKEFVSIKNENMVNFRTSLPPNTPIDHDGIARFVRDERLKNPQYNPIEGLNNIAANAGMYKEPGEVRGELPLNWKMNKLLQNWGFQDAKHFYSWWENGGRTFVSRI